MTTSTTRLPGGGPADRLIGKAGHAGDERLPQSTRVSPTAEYPFDARHAPTSKGCNDCFHAIAANQGCIRQLESAERFTCGRAEPALSTSIGSQPGSRYVLCHDSERRRHHDNTRLLDLRARAYERTCGPPDGFRVGQERTTTTLPEARPSPT